MKSSRFERKDSVGKIIGIYVILTIFSLIALYPVLNILSVALRPGNSLFSTDLSIIPDNATLENFKLAFTKYDLALWIKNSLYVSLLTTFISVIFSLSAGYAFSRFSFFGRLTGMKLLLVTQMFPATMMLLPLKLILVKFGFDNSHLGLIVVYVSTTIPFNVWMMKGYFDTISKSIEESAYVDGASVVSTFYKIILPLAKPAIALTALISFMSAWSEYIVARAIVNEPTLLTLPIGLTNMQGQFQSDWGVYSAAALMTALPVMILFVSLSRYLVGGLTLGGVKE